MCFRGRFSWIPCVCGVWMFFPVAATVVVPCGAMVRVTAVKNVG